MQPQSSYFTRPIVSYQSPSSPSRGGPAATAMRKPRGSRVRDGYVVLMSRAKQGKGPCRTVASARQTAQGRLGGGSPALRRPFGVRRWCAPQVRIFTHHTTSPPLRIKYCYSSIDRLPFAKRLHGTTIRAFSRECQHEVVEAPRLVARILVEAARETDREGARTVRHADVDAELHVGPVAVAALKHGRRVVRTR